MDTQSNEPGLDCSGSGIEGVIACSRRLGQFWKEYDLTQFVLAQSILLSTQFLNTRTITLDGTTERRLAFCSYLPTQGFVPLCS